MFVGERNWMVGMVGQVLWRAGRAGLMRNFRKHHNANDRECKDSLEDAVADFTI